VALEKSPLDWQEEDLQELIDAQIEESARLEFKRQLNLKTVKEKKEVAKDVSAFANANGGVLIYGIAESGEEGKPMMASALTPISEPNLEKRLEDILLSATSPRLDVRIKTIQSVDGYYIVVDIPQGYPKLCMVTLGGENRYYRRRNFQVQMMTQEEIKEAYLRMGEASQEVLAKCRSTRLDPKVNDAVLAQIVAVPIFGHDLLIDPPRHGVGSFRKLPSEQKRRYSIPSEHLAPGSVGFEYIRSSSSADYKALRLLESGHLEWIDSYQSSRKIVPSTGLLYDLHDALLYFASVYQTVGYFGSVQLCYRLMGLKGSKLGTGISELYPPLEEHEWERAFQFDVSSMEREPLKIVKQFMDLLWCAYGYARCFSFNEEGELVV
jgi:hypothetical protein